MRSSGRSPRARGSLDRLLVLIVEVGSIPACAGEPRARGTCAARCGVDPRVRGGAALPMYSSIFEKGRSPRARGSLASLVEQLVHPGSIPACAGEPIGMQTLGEDRRVDPRVRGGATGSGSVTAPVRGRSPRARGSLRWPCVDYAAWGSIPACAGEPPTSPWWAAITRVDPRVRGGARRTTIPYRSVMGRSPRARGSLDHSGVGVPGAGSIPACAGEPALRFTRLGEPRVDPRVRGGARRTRRASTPHRGRSPRARGSPGAAAYGPTKAGSIPACAGEPGPCGLYGWGAGVDPRVRGGAFVNANIEAGGVGRSPRARGSRLPAGRLHGLHGSIPACAGEPQATRSRPCYSRVDPRVRGGAWSWWTRTTAQRGRSPRARGSLNTLSAPAL